MAIAIVLGYVQFGPLIGTVILAALGGVSLVLFWIWMRYFQKTRVGRGLTLGTSLSSGNELPPSKNLIGKTGVSSTDLRPTGRAMIDEERIEVMAETGFIEAGTPIIVIAADGNRILVRKNS
jgi:membrane-bound serine protease (ClpP class)